MSANSEALASDTSAMSMTSMFLAQIVDSGMIEHRRQTDAAIARWNVYRDRDGQEFYYLWSQPEPDWVKV